MASLVIPRSECLVFSWEPLLLSFSHFCFLDSMNPYTHCTSECYVVSCWGGDFRIWSKMEDQIRWFFSWFEECHPFREVVGLVSPSLQQEFCKSVYVDRDDFHLIEKILKQNCDLCNVLCNKLCFTLILGSVFASTKVTMDRNMSCVWGNFRDVSQILN